MRKKDLTVMILMAIMLILIVAFIIIIGSKHLSSEAQGVISNQEEKNKIEKLEEEKESLTIEEQDYLLSQIEAYDFYFITFDGKKQPTEMTNQEKFEFVIKLGEERLNVFGIDVTKQISAGKVLEVLNHYFGPTITFEPETYLCPIDHLPYFVYDQSTKTFMREIDEHGHGIPTFTVKSFDVTSSKIENSQKTTYTVSLKKVFSNIYQQGVPTSFYKSYQDANNQINEIFTGFDPFASSLDDFIKTNYNQNKEDFLTYTYTFETTATFDKAYLVNLVQSS